MTSIRLVIANRGEIARRILSAARLRGWTTAVISTPEDRDARVRLEADAVLEVASFLDGPAITAAAQAWGAHLLHPGYGFLSEDAAFAQCVEDAGITFVGPTAASMRALGRKEAAKTLAAACGVPVLPALLSHEHDGLDPQALFRALEARDLQAPYLVKASGGGGGRGMRVVPDVQGLPAALALAASEAQAGFGDPTVFIERYLPSPRHVEVQIFGDGAGGGVFLGERECSLQRRHQKVLEECPSSAVDARLREKLGRAALALVQAASYRGAGTVEFLLEPNGRFWFLEMNTRLQVEHPVTEAVLGIDLVQAQFDLALGTWPEALGDPGAFHMPTMAGVALEARLLAEDPREGFMPTPGPLRRFEPPPAAAFTHRDPATGGPAALRIDTGVLEGDRVNDRFDPMIAKVIAWGPDRATAAERLAQGLSAITLHGCVTNLPFLATLARHPDVVAGRTSTDWITRHLADLDGGPLPAELRTALEDRPFRAALSASLSGLGHPEGPAALFAAQRHPELTVDGTQPILPPRLQVAGGHGTLHLPEGPILPFTVTRHRDTLWLTLHGETLRLADPLAHHAAARPGTTGTGEVRSPMAGTVLEVRAAEGESVEEGQVLFLLESMKMRLEVCAPLSGILQDLQVQPGQTLTGPERLAEVVPQA